MLGTLCINGSVRPYMMFVRDLSVPARAFSARIVASCASSHDAIVSSRSVTKAPSAASPFRRADLEVVLATECQDWRGDVLEQGLVDLRHLVSLSDL